MRIHPLEPNESSSMLLFVVGEYTMLSMVVNSSGVELGPGHERLPTVALPE